MAPPPPPLPPPSSKNEYEYQNIRHFTSSTDGHEISPTSSFNITARDWLLIICDVTNQARCPRLLESQKTFTLPAKTAFECQTLHIHHPAERSLKKTHTTRKTHYCLEGDFKVHPCHYPWAVYMSFKSGQVYF